MRAIDWFSSSGGYTLAMRKAGIEVVGACERDPAKRLEYGYANGLVGVPGWFAEDAYTAENIPAADLWTAVESNPRLVEWIGKQVAEHHPCWVYCETVRQDEQSVIRALLDCGYFVRWQYAGIRVHVVAGPVSVQLPELPEHDRALGPRSDARAVGAVLGAILAADAQYVQAGSQP